MSETVEQKNWRPIRDQVAAPGGLAAIAATTALGLVSYFVLPEWKVPAQIVASIVIVAIAYTWFAQSALRVAGRRIMVAENRPDRPLEPRVRQSMVGSQQDEVILLLEPSRLFGQSMLVSVYFEDERGFELLVAQGRVVNIQTNGLIQIALTSWEAGHDDLKRSILAQQIGRLDKLLVKPAPVAQVSSSGDDMTRLLLNYLENQRTASNDVG